MTREYARFVNQQPVILRIILYLLTGIIFVATIIIDVVLMNTMDFWSGRVSQGTYEFKEGEKTFVVKHEFQPGTQLKRSTIKITGANHTLLQEVVLNETGSGEIELLVDGKLRTKVRDIHGLPVAAIYGVSGNIVKERLVLTEVPLVLAGH